MIENDQDHIHVAAEPLVSTSSVGPRPHAPNVVPWTPSLAALLLSGISAGGVLGAADGMAFHYIVGGFPTPIAACLWGAGLGIVGGILFVLARRAVFGPHISVDVGTMLGLLYGMVPGLAILYQSIFVQRAIGGRMLVGVVMACSMAGLVIGGLLDRITDTMVARPKRLEESRAAETEW